jgi:hypothetical protein
MPIWFVLRPEIPIAKKKNTLTHPKFMLPFETDEVDCRWAEVIFYCVFSMAQPWSFTASLKSYTIDLLFSESRIISINRRPSVLIAKS